MAKLRKNELRTKEIHFFFMPSCNNFAIFMAKLQKKVVTANGFWRINAIRPKIKAKRGRTRKFKIRGNAKLGGLVKELGFLIVTLNYRRTDMSMLELTPEFIKDFSAYLSTDRGLANATIWQRCGCRPPWPHRPDCAATPSEGRCWWSASFSLPTGNSRQSVWR